MYRVLVFVAIPWWLEEINLPGGLHDFHVQR